MIEAVLIFLYQIFVIKPMGLLLSSPQDAQ